MKNSPESRLQHFKDKYMHTTQECTAEEKEELLKHLGSDYIIRVSEMNYKNPQKPFLVTYMPKMTKQDKKEFRNLKISNAVTALKALTWEMLNVRNDKLLDDIYTGIEKIPVKTIKLNGVEEFTVLDLTDYPHFTWMIHTTPNNAENLNLMREQIKEGILWENFPFLSCSVQDGYTKSYAGSQSIGHGQMPFAISLMLSVDPAGIIGTFPYDARSPEGPHKAIHLKYASTQTVTMMAGDQKHNNSLPKYNISKENKRNEDELEGVKETLRETRAYNEIIVLSGELAKDWGVKPPQVRAIVIEKIQLNSYMETRQTNNKFHGDIAAMIKFAQDCNLPILLIDPKPSLTLQKELYNERYQLEEDTDPYFFLYEIVNHYIAEFEKLCKDPNIDDQIITWYQEKIGLLTEIKQGIHNFKLQRTATTIEDQIIFKIIANEADLYYYNYLLEHWKTKAQEVNKEVSTPENQRLLTKYNDVIEKLKQREHVKKQDLEKYNKELNTHHAGLNFTTKGRPHG